jgi:hypothetical protein
MKNISLKLFIFSILFTVTACSRYTVENETFYSSAEAIQKQSQAQSQVLSEIIPTKKPIHGIALLIYPTDDELLKTHVRYENNPSIIGDEQIDFIKTAFEQNCKFICNAIIKQSIFDSVSIDLHNGQPASYYNENYDYIIFYDIDGWFIKGKKHPKPLEISYDLKIPLKPRMMAFLDLLGQQADFISKY